MTPIRREANDLSRAVHLVCLVYLSSLLRRNHINQKNQMSQRNRMKQFPATRRELCHGTVSMGYRSKRACLTAHLDLSSLSAYDFFTVER